MKSALRFGPHLSYPLPHETDMPGIDSREFRDALGRFATGVAVVTTCAPDRSPVGITVNSFTSVSLEPPLVLFCIDRSALSCAVFESASHFAVNILTACQRALSDRFAATSNDKWTGVAYHVGSDGCPLLSDTLGQMVCKSHAVYDGGDHAIVVGEVLSAAASRGDPLLYYRGSYAGLDVSGD